MKLSTCSVTHRLSVKQLGGTGWKVFERIVADCSVDIQRHTGKTTQFEVTVSSHLLHLTKRIKVT